MTCMSSFNAIACYKTACSPLGTHIAFRPFSRLGRTGAQDDTDWSHACQSFLALHSAMTDAKREPTNHLGIACTTFIFTYPVSCLIGFVVGTGRFFEDAETFNTASW